jgi:hypothetical protein
MEKYMKKLYRLLFARYLVSAYWNGIQTHPAKSFSEAMEWVACYPQVPVSIVKRTGFFKFEMYAQRSEPYLF